MSLRAFALPPLAHALLALGLVALGLVAIAHGASATALAQEVPHGLERTRAPVRMPAHWPRSPLLSDAREAAQIDLAWERFGTRGRGAEVCIVDTGVDLRHRDFRDATGQTRARFAVEIGATPRGVEPDLEARGAAIWSRAQLDERLAGGGALPGDTHGHGTAIASAAVGDDAEGSLDAGPGSGAAPQASIVIIDALRPGASGFEDADVLLAVDLCIALATRGPDAIGRDRQVILLALGGHDGAHDGEGPFERALGDRVRAGATIVAAAGNDGGRPIHASGRLFASEIESVPLFVPTPRAVAEALVVVTVVSEGEVSLVGPSGARIEGSPLRTRTLESPDGVLQSEGREDGSLLFTIRGNSALPLRGGAWSVELRGPARFDIWLVAHELGPTLFAPALDGARVAMGETVTIPATARELIAVGALVTRAVDGALRFEADGDGAARSSAEGPGSGGAPRPDIAAPGGLIAAALSADLDPDDPRSLFGGERAAYDRARRGADRVIIGGTSVAAAITAGAYALAFSLAPAAPSRDSALLRSSALSETAWSPRLGAGALAVAAWLEARRTSDARTFDPSRSLVSSTRSQTVPAADVFVVARVHDRDGVPFTGAEMIVRSGAQIVGRAPILSGSASARLGLVGARVGDTLTLEAAIDDVALGHTVVEIVADEGHNAAVRAIGGGCSVGAPRDGPHLFAAVLWAFALGLTRERRFSVRDRRRA